MENRSISPHKCLFVTSGIRAEHTLAHLHPRTHSHPRGYQRWGAFIGVVLTNCEIMNMLAGGGLPPEVNGRSRARILCSRRRARLRPVLSYPRFPRFSSPRLTHVQRGPAEKHTQAAGEGQARPKEIPQARASRGWTRYTF